MNECEWILMALALGLPVSDEEKRSAIARLLEEMEFVRQLQSGKPMVIHGAGEFRVPFTYK